jgi:hypothetical protein
MGRKVQECRSVHSALKGPRILRAVILLSRRPFAQDFVHERGIVIKKRVVKILSSVIASEISGTEFSRHPTPKFGEITLFMALALWKSRVICWMD